MACNEDISNTCMDPIKSTCVDHEGDLGVNTKNRRRLCKSI